MYLCNLKRYNKKASWGPIWLPKKIKDRAIYRSGPYDLIRRNNMQTTKLDTNRENDPRVADIQLDISKQMGLQGNDAERIITSSIDKACSVGQV